MKKDEDLNLNDTPKKRRCKNTKKSQELQNKTDEMSTTEEKTDSSQNQKEAKTPKKTLKRVKSKTKENIVSEEKVEKSAVEEKVDTNLIEEKKANSEEKKANSEENAEVAIENQELSKELSEDSSNNIENANKDVTIVQADDEEVVELQEESDLMQLTLDDDSDKEHTKTKRDWRIETFGMIPPDKMEALVKLYEKLKSEQEKEKKQEQLTKNHDENMQNDKIEDTDNSSEQKENAEDTKKENAEDTDQPKNEKKEQIRDEEKFKQILHALSEQFIKSIESNEQFTSDNTDDIDEDDPILLHTPKTLPKEVLLFPFETKPVIPGVLVPIFVHFDIKIQKFIEYIEEHKENYIGFTYSLHLDKVFTEDTNMPLEVIPLDIRDLPDIDESGTVEDLNSQIFFQKVGVIAQIFKIVQLATGDYQFIVRGVKRFVIKKMRKDDDVWYATLSYPKIIPASDSVLERAFCESIKSILQEIVKTTPYFPDEIKLLLNNINITKSEQLCDFALLVMNSSTKDVQKSLECFDTLKRLRYTLEVLSKVLDFAKIRAQINSEIDENVHKQHRDYMLKEQLKAIKKELGLEKDESSLEISQLKKKLKGKKLSKEATELLNEEMHKLSLIDSSSPEYSMARNYLDCFVSLPWGKVSTDNFDIEIARKILDEDHYGLDDVKDRLIEFLAVGKLCNKIEGSILCLVGPPGVGKTSLGKSVARALNREFFRFSVGGMHDEAEIKGHRRTYIGAMPGKLIQALKTVGTDNPVIMLDEIDKIGKDYRGDPASALLEALDPEQNKDFRDHYLNVAYDLSKILFIVTANVLDTIPAPLKDRMEIIHLPGYIKQEKVAIAQQHLIPKQQKKHGLSSEQLVFTPEALDTIIESYAREAGVRSLEKQLMKIMRKTAVKLVKKEAEKIEIVPQNIEDFLGMPFFKESPLDKDNLPGITVGLAWTSLGGCVLNIESIAKVGKPFSFKQTGQLGEVMVESSNIAYSYVSTHAKLFDIATDYFAKRQVHLHVPEGATPKDGPSAGVTMATSLISLAKNKPIKKSLAMTGELTLTGRVLPVGGIREKLIAAKRANIKTVLLPAENKRDIKEIPEYVLENLDIHFVETYPEVYALAFEENAETSHNA